MPKRNARTKQLIAKRRDLLHQLSQQKAMVRGSLVLKKLTCGNARCRCRRGQRHRAYYLSFLEDRKTKTVFIPTDLLPEVREAIRQYKRHKQIVGEIVAVNLSLLQERKRLRRKGED